MDDRGARCVRGTSTNGLSRSIWTPSSISGRLGGERSPEGCASSLKSWSLAGIEFVGFLEGCFLTNVSPEDLRAGSVGEFVAPSALGKAQWLEWKKSLNANSGDAERDRPRPPKLDNLTELLPIIATQRWTRCSPCVKL